MRKVDLRMILSALVYMGYSVHYLDTNRKRLRQAKEMGCRAFDVSRLYGQSSEHPDVLVSILTDAWHPDVKKEYKMWASGVSIEILESKLL